MVVHRKMRDPRDIAAFHPERHHTMVEAARKLAGWANDCALPAALVVFVAKDPERHSITECICWEVLDVVARAFDQIVPGVRLEAIQ
jgi:hypothetical protein